MVSSTFVIRNVIHEDNYTETMDCIGYLLSSIKSHDDAIPIMSLSRAVVTLLHYYLAEIMFWSTADNFIEENRAILPINVVNQIKPGASLTFISLSRAIEEWPAMLIKKSFDFDKDPFSSFKILIKYRNMLTHSNDYDMISYYLENYESAASTYYTAMKISEEIENHCSVSQEENMGEFRRIAERIAAHLSDLAAGRRKISAEELAKIGSDVADREEINLYPGVPCYECYDLSLFISLSSPGYVKGKRGHLSCRQAIEKVVQHMQGTCMNKTHVAILVADSWDSSASDEWKANLQRITNTAHLEIYLIAGRKVSEIQI